MSTSITQPPTPGERARDTLFRVGSTAAAATTLVAVVALVVATAWGGSTAMRAYGLSFLTGTEMRVNLTSWGVGIEAADDDRERPRDPRPEGFRVRVRPDGAFAEAGIQDGDLLVDLAYRDPAGDWITTPTPSLEAVQAFLAESEIGDGVRATVRRDHAPHRYDLYLVRMIPDNGILPEIWGTLYTSLLALLFASVLGLFVAIFLTEGFLPKTLEFLVQNLIELLAAIPSVVFGLWGIFVLIPLLRSTLAVDSLTPSLLPATIVLTIMILPTVTALARDAIGNVPRAYREAALGLGATKWEVILKVVLPTATGGIMGAVVLAFGRALGETMALAMLAGNKGRITLDLLSPGNTLAAMIANDWNEASPGLEQSGLMYAATVLLVITLLVNTAGGAIVRRSTRHLGATR